MAEEQKWQDAVATNHVLCANNCGFFGSSTTLNLCSKCYKDHCLKERNISTAKIAVEQSLTSDSSHAPPSMSHAPLNRFESESSLSVKPSHAPQFTAHAPINRLESESSSSSDVHVSVKSDHAPPSLDHRFESESSSSDVVSVSLKLNHALPRARSESENTDLVVINADDVTPLPQKRNRCGSCKKRVGLTGFTCRCGTTFCGTHRYPEKHACSFDFKTMGKEAIARDNPVVKAAKLDKI